VLNWIVITVLYVAGIAFFRLIGGLDSAADGLKKWGAPMPSASESGTGCRHRQDGEGTRFVPDPHAGRKWKVL
jgi:hypothetical protein